MKDVFEPVITFEQYKEMIEEKEEEDYPIC